MVRVCCVSLNDISLVCMYVSFINKKYFSVVLVGEWGLESSGMRNSCVWNEEIRVSDGVDNALNWYGG